MEAYRRAHPVTVLFNLGRVFYLVIIPVLRGFVSAFRGGFAGWLSGAWADILVFLLMICIAVAGWLAVRFRFDDGRIEMRSGLLNQRRVFIPWDKVTTVSLIRLFYLRPIRALRIRADTLGGNSKSPDFMLFLSNRQARSLLRSRKLPAGELFGKVYQPSTASIVALSLLTSGSFSGILFISTFISQSGKLLGKEFSDTLIGTFEEFSRKLAFGIPPAAAAIAYILLAGWFIGFIRTFMRYKNFTLTRKKNTLGISGGIFTVREYHIRYTDVNFIDIRQSLITRFLKLSSLYISAVGYNKQKGDISSIIPTESEARFDVNLKKIFPAMNPVPREHKPEVRGIMRFIGSPLFCIAGIILAIAVLIYLFPLWNDFIQFTGLMALVPAVLFLCVDIIDFRTCGLSFDENNYTIRYSSGFSLHTVVIPADRIVCIELKQGAFQKFGSYCDLIISTKSEGRSYHRCRGLIKSDLSRLFNV